MILMFQGNQWSYMSAYLGTCVFHTRFQIFSFICVVLKANLIYNLYTILLLGLKSTRVLSGGSKGHLSKYL